MYITCIQNCKSLIYKDEKFFSCYDPICKPWNRLNSFMNVQLLLKIYVAQVTVFLLDENYLHHIYPLCWHCLPISQGPGGGQTTDVFSEQTVQFQFSWKEKKNKNIFKWFEFSHHQNLTARQRWLVNLTIANLHVNYN